MVGGRGRCMSHKRSETMIRSWLRSICGFRCIRNWGRCNIWGRGRSIRSRGWGMIRSWNWCRCMVRSRRRSIGNRLNIWGCGSIALP